MGYNPRMTSKKVRFGADDVPDEYGFTKKMYAICKLVDNGKSIEDADFEVTKYDKIYYESEKDYVEFCKLKGQSPVRFVNDI